MAEPEHPTKRTMGNLLALVPLPKSYADMTDHERDELAKRIVAEANTSVQR